MRYLKYLVLAGLLIFPAAIYGGHFSFGVVVGPSYYPGYYYAGPPPVCPYGYFPYYPYGCAPYGYYGPQYFVDGAFIGAGPWHRGFRGRFDFDRFDGRGFRGRGSFERRDFGPRGRSFGGGFRGERFEGSFRGNRGGGNFRHGRR
ncbi:MAG: hypothetical protein PHX83_17410 [Acidobacteriia bacterium]|nr:hypothetical protein [Terriglobia bacterium]